MDGTLHQHPAPDPVPRQGGRPARRLPLRHLVHLPARAAPEDALRRQHPAARPGLQEPDLGLRLRPGRPAEHAHPGRARRHEDPDGDQRLLHRRPGQHLAGLRRAQGRRLDHLRLLDLLRHLPGAGPEPRRRSREPDPPGQPRRASRLGLRLAGQPAHPLQPRLGPTRTARPGASARSGSGGTAQRKWTGYDVPDFPLTKAPDAPAEPGRHRPRRPLRHRPVHHEGGRQGLALRADRAGGRPAADPLRAGRVAGRRTRSTRPADQPGAQVLARDGQPAGRASAIRATRYVITTYRLTEHYLSGAMSRWLPWLAELQPELFVEISPELAQEKGIANLDWVRITTPARRDPGQGAGHRPDAPVHDRRADASTTSACRGTGATGPRHRRRRQRPHRAGRRPERHDPRGQGVRVQRGEGD